MKQQFNAAITAERLRELLDYDPKTGIFTNKARRKGAKQGAVSGHLRSDGYIHIGLDGDRYLAHRLAFRYMTGEWPKNEVDHRDLNFSHNAWNNLRDCSTSDNHRNVRMYACNRTGFKGVQPNKSGTFRAQITIDRKVIHLGTYKQAHEAHQAYWRKAVEVSPEFARAA